MAPEWSIINEKLFEFEILKLKVGLQLDGPKSLKLKPRMLSHRPRMAAIWDLQTENRLAAMSFNVDKLSKF